MENCGGGDCTRKTCRNMRSDNLSVDSSAKEICNDLANQMIRPVKKCVCVHVLDLLPTERG